MLNGLFLVRLPLTFRIFNYYTPESSLVGLHIWLFWLKGLTLDSRLTHMSKHSSRLHCLKSATLRPQLRVVYSRVESMRWKLTGSLINKSPPLQSLLSSSSWSKYRWAAALLVAPVNCTWDKIISCAIIITPRLLCSWCAEWLLVFACCNPNLTQLPYMLLLHSWQSKLLFVKYNIRHLTCFPLSTRYCIS